MIRSFRDKDTEAIWQRRYVKKLSPELSRLTHNKLVLINAAESINDLRVPPGNRLEKLSGNRAGQYSASASTTSGGSASPGAPTAPGTSS